MCLIVCAFTFTMGWGQEQRNAIKTSFLSPLFGSLSFGHEHVLSSNVGFEGRLGLIGIGTPAFTNNTSGVYLKVGTKFYLEKNREDLMDGAYIKPEANISMVYGKTGFFDTGAARRQYALAFLINFGKQHVVAHAFTIDYYMGFGYAISESGYWYSHMALGREFPLALSMGMTIGVPF